MHVDAESDDHRGAPGRVDPFRQDSRHFAFTDQHVVGPFQRRRDTRIPQQAFGDPQSREQRQPPPASRRDIERMQQHGYCHPVPGGADQVLPWRPRPADWKFAINTLLTARRNEPARPDRRLWSRLPRPLGLRPGAFCAAAPCEALPRRSGPRWAHILYTVARVHTYGPPHRRDGDSHRERSERHSSRCAARNDSASEPTPARAASRMCTRRQASWLI